MTTEAYFTALSAALRAAEIHRPALVLDLDRLDANIATVKAHLATAGLPLRIVDKSLPCLPLLAHVKDAFGSVRFMTFHLPIATAVHREFPDAELLLGKPMPVGAVRHAISSGALARTSTGASRIVWLIDTDERLEAYGALARELDVDLALCFEVDVGLHRGGYATPKSLARALATLRTHPRLRCRGIMGYEAHVGHVPALLGGPRAALARAKRRFAGFAAQLGPDQREILNIGGSSTALLYDRNMSANEVCMGSAFVTPTDFDVPSLARLVPASFIATPILKVLDARAPGLDDRTWILQRLGRFPRRGCFLYGGKWMAKPVHPAGMTPFPTFSNSTNQQFMALPDDSQAKPDDYAFLRPTQSEFVFQQFGPLAVYSRGRIVDRWPVLAPA